MLIDEREMNSQCSVCQQHIKLTSPEDVELGDRSSDGCQVMGSKDCREEDGGGTGRDLHCIKCGKLGEG
jgi:hypothetical protein